MENELAFNGANYVTRQLNWSMPGGWGQGVKSAEAWFRPPGTFAERFDELLAEVAALGFTAYDLWCAQLDGAWATSTHIEAARAAAERHGIRLTSYAGGPFGETAEECERVCALLAALDVPVLAGYSAFAERDAGAFAALLEKYGLRYGRENHPEASPAELLAKIEDIPSDRVGVTVDTGWFATQSYDPAAAIRELGPAVEYIHLKDVRAAGAHDTCAFAEGIVDIAECLRAAADIGYDGPLSIEHEPEEGDPRDAVARSRALVESLLTPAN